MTRPTLLRQFSFRLHAPTPTAQRPSLPRRPTSPTTPHYNPLSMSSCVMPAPLPVPTSIARRSLKRPLASTEDAMSIDRILKAHKRSTVDSPRAMAAPFVAAPATKQYAASWPQITTAETVQNAIAFLRDSRQHALVLLTQNQWQRALSVLDKVERANDIVARQRRKVVLEQSNASNAFLQCLENDLQPTKATRKVRFHEEVQVATAVDADRSPAKVPGFVKEEILILRASRPIPKENYSEFWN